MMMNADLQESIYQVQHFFDFPFWAGLLVGVMVTVAFFLTIGSCLSSKN